MNKISEALIRIYELEDGTLCIQAEYASSSDDHAPEDYVDRLACLGARLLSDYVTTVSGTNPKTRVGTVEELEDEE